MIRRNTLFLSVLFGVGLSLAPLRAQDPPQKLPSSDQSKTMWTGSLVDADCRMNSPTAKCDISESTILFGLQSGDNKYYRLDGDGNAKVLAALKSAEKKTGAVNVSINGTLNGETLKVSTVEIR